MIRLFILISTLFFSCQDDPVSDDNSNALPSTLYVCDQMGDKVLVLDSSTDDLELIESIAIDYNPSMNDRPHFIAIDESNGYWFVSTFMSGYVGMYSLEDNTLIKAIVVGDSPALLVVDPTTMKLYASRMMTMMGMSGGETSEISVIDYSSGEPVLESAINLAQGEDILEFPEPHALSIGFGTTRGTLLATASLTTDWFSMITLGGSQPLVTPFPFNEGEVAPTVVNELQAIQSTQKDDHIFFSCSGNDVEIDGQVQSWSVLFQTKENTFMDFETESAKPWHIVASPTTNEIFVALRGTSNGDGGVACLRYDDNGTLTKKWETTNSSFSMIHGVAVSGDGQSVYASSAGDGKIHIFASEDGTLIASRSAADMQATGIAVTQSIE